MCEEEKKKPRANFGGIIIRVVCHVVVPEADCICSLYSVCRRPKLFCSLILLDVDTLAWHQVN